MITRHGLAYAAIRGLYNGVLLFIPAYAVAWLVIGHRPAFWTTFLISEALEVAIRIFLWHRKRQEIRALQATYDQPAYGDH